MFVKDAYVGTQSKTDSRTKKITYPSNIHELERKYISFSGTDAVAFIQFPNTEPFVIGQVQGIEYAVYREKIPVRTLGRISPKGVARGGVTIAGSIYWALLKENLVDDIRKRVEYLVDIPNLRADELPPFDLFIFFANEYGATAYMAIYGIDIVDAHQTLMITNVLTENVWTFMARDIEEVKAGTKASGLGSPTTELNKLVSEALPMFNINDLYTAKQQQALEKQKQDMLKAQAQQNKFWQDLNKARNVSSAQFSANFLLQSTRGITLTITKDNKPFKNAYVIIADALGQSSIVHYKKLGNAYIIDKQFKSIHFRLGSTGSQTYDKNHGGYEFVKEYRYYVYVFSDADSSFKTSLNNLNDSDPYNDINVYADYVFEFTVTDGKGNQVLKFNYKSSSSNNGVNVSIVNPNTNKSIPVKNSVNLGTKQEDNRFRANLKYTRQPNQSIVYGVYYIYQYSDRKKVIPVIGSVPGLFYDPPKYDSSTHKETTTLYMYIKNVAEDLLNLYPKEDNLPYNKFYIQFVVCDRTNYKNVVARSQQIEVPMSSLEKYLEKEFIDTKKSYFEIYADVRAGIFSDTVTVEKIYLSDPNLKSKLVKYGITYSDVNHIYFFSYNKSKLRSGVEDKLKNRYSPKGIERVFAKLNLSIFSKYTVYRRVEG